jgi:hypothetical protein
MSIKGLYAGLVSVFAITCVLPAAAQTAATPGKSAPTMTVVAPNAPPSPVAPSFPCGAAVQNYLWSYYGVSVADMKNVKMITDAGALGSSPQAAPYTFSGQPAKCSRGGIVMQLWRSCQIYEAHTTGGCSL